MKRLNPCSVAMACAFAITTFLSCQGSTGTADPPPEVKPDELFAAYGIKTTLPKQAAGYNPFGRKVVQLQARREIYFSGLYAQSRLVNLWDDFEAGGSPTTTSLITYGSGGTDPVFAKKPQASAAGDIDGDGKEEVVTAYFTATTNSGTIVAGKNTGKAYLCVMGKDETLASGIEIPGSPDIAYNVRNTGQYLQGRMDIALGDLDGDGTKEIGIVVGDTFMILRRSSGGGYGLLYTKDFREGKHDNDTAKNIPWAQVNWYVRIDAGDVNGDGKDEFVAMSGYWSNDVGGYATATYSVVGGASPSELYSGTVNDTSGGNEILFGNVAVGDLDGDGIKEICFSGISNRTTNTLIDCKVITAWWNGSGFTMPGGDKTLAYSFPSGRNQYRPLPSSCFKPRLGTKEALFAINRVIEYDGAKLSITANLPENPSYNPDYLADFEQVIATGDVDRDGLDDIVALYIGATKTLCVYPGTGTGSLVAKATVTNDTNYAYNTGGTGVYMSLCLPDWDGDSVTLSFIDSNVMYTEPKVVAVIASPPFWADLVDAGSRANYSTSYGKKQTDSYERTDTFGVGLEVSYSEGLSGDLGFTLEYGAAVGASFAYTKVYSTESVMSQTESTIAGEDKVLYMSLPYDVYRFTVLSSPNAASVGTEYAISIPRRPLIRSMELTAFNALPHNPVPIEAAFMDHSIGDPGSYLTKTEMRAALAGGGFWDVNGQPTGRASSSTASSVEQGTTTGDQFTVGASLKISGKAGVLWHTVGVEASYNYEWNSTVSTGSGTSISGTIPDIPVGTPLNRDYSYGIALYKKTLPSQSDPVMVVSYWVEQ